MALMDGGQITQGFGRLLGVLGVVRRRLRELPCVVVQGVLLRLERDGAMHLRVGGVFHGVRTIVRRQFLVRIRRRAAVGQPADVGSAQYLGRRTKGQRMTPAKASPTANERGVVCILMSDPLLLCLTLLD